jgi:hypothetical protein
MAQTASDKYARVRTMLFDNGDTWDLSTNDKEALRHVLGMVNALASEVAEYRGTTVPDVIDSCNELVERGESA